MALKVSRDQLAACKEDELFLHEAAARLGVAPATIARAERVYGLRLERAPGGAPGGPVTGLRSVDAYREAVQSMRPLDAVEFLLAEIGAFLPEDSPPWASAFEPAGLTASEARIVAAIVAARGRTATRAALHAALYSDSVEAPEPKIIDVYICKIRRKIGQLPFRIVTVWGEGFRLEVAPGVCAPWDIATDQHQEAAE